MKGMMRIAWIIPAFVFLFSCSGAEQQRKNIFRYNESKGIPTLDPAFARNQTIIWPVNQLFNGLVQLDEKLHVMPCIARSWEISETGTLYTFYLRSDVFFHDHPAFPEGRGRAVTADDFVFSLNRISDPQLASPGAWIFHSVERRALDGQYGFEAVNDTIFRIYLSRPFPAFLGILSMPYCNVVPHEVVEKLGPDFRKEPVGTGPFRFKYWREDEKLVLVRNERYFERDKKGTQLPYLDAINISFTRDKQSEFMEFMMGRLDFLSGLHPVYKDELVTRAGKLNPAYSGRIKMITEPYLNTEYLGFLLDPEQEAVQNSPVLTREVRQAINVGFDRHKMMRYLRNNIGSPAVAGFIPEGLPSYNAEKVKGYSYDPDMARALLSRAGYPNGKGLPGITLTTTSDYQDLCEYIQHELSEVGIRLNIEVNTGASFRNRMANSRLEFFRGSWIADYPDAENYLSLFYTRNFSPAGPNYTHFSHPEYDRLFEEALMTLDDSARYAIYQELDRIIVQEAAVVPLYYDQVVRFVPESLSGLGSNPMNLLHLKNVHWSDKSLKIE
jgi:oligopeptide transport system substrate-binding protein